LKGFHYEYLSLGISSIVDLGLGLYLKNGLCKQKFCWPTYTSHLSQQENFFSHPHDSFSPPDIPILPPRYLWSDCVIWKNMRTVVRLLSSDMCSGSLFGERNCRQWKISVPMQWNVFATWRNVIDHVAAVNSGLANQNYPFFL
jgi:hypothetical protein